MNSLLKNRVRQIMEKEMPNLPNGSMMKAAMEKNIAECETKSISACATLINGFVQTVENAKSHLIACRKSEKAAKKNLESFGRALSYFAETDNPFPFFVLIGGDGVKNGQLNSMHFCREIGIKIPEAEDPIWTIPSDWTPDNSENPPQS